MEMYQLKLFFFLGYFLDDFTNTIVMLFEVLLSFVILMFVCFVISKVIGPILR